MYGETEGLIFIGKVLGYLSLGVYSVLLALLSGPALLIRKIASSFRDFGVDSWPLANGSITQRDVSAIHGWIVDYARGQLEYTYRLRGEYYAGTITRHFLDEQAAWSFVDAHRDDPVVVRYRDDKPQVSRLLIADQGPAWLPIGEPGLLAQVWRHVRNEVRG